MAWAFFSVTLVLLLISVGINALFFFWQRRHIAKMYDDGIAMADLERAVEEFHAIVEESFSLKDFYGDPAIMRLMEGALDVRAHLNAYRDLIDMVNQDERIEVYEKFVSDEEKEAASRKLWADHLNQSAERSGTSAYDLLRKRYGAK